MSKRNEELIQKLAGMLSQTMGDQGPGTFDLNSHSLAQQTDLIERAASQMMSNQQRFFQSAKMGEE